MENNKKQLFIRNNSTREDIHPVTFSQNVIGSQDIKLRITDNTLEVSYDNGVTWQVVGAVGGGGGTGVTVVKSPSEPQDKTLGTIWIQTT